MIIYYYNIVVTIAERVYRRAFDYNTVVVAINSLAYNNIESKTVSLSIPETHRERKHDNII